MHVYFWYVLKRVLLLGLHGHRSLEINAHCEASCDAPPQIHMLKS